MATTFNPNSQDSKSQGNSMNLIGTYKTKSGRFVFRWSFERQRNSEVRAYVVEMPTYGERQTTGYLTHLNWDGERRYIDFQPMPQTYEHAVAIAEVWAERTETYIVSGETF
jgi:hypothetical protein